MCSDVFAFRPSYMSGLADFVLYFCVSQDRYHGKKFFQDFDAVYVKIDAYWYLTCRFLDYLREDMGYNSLNHEALSVQRFYMVGVGPGDPELLTLRAKRVLEEVGCIFVPKGREEGTSLALSIVERIVDTRSKKIVEAHFPMIKTKQKEDELFLKWDGIAKDILKNLEREDVAFITLGDPSMYSTSFYVYQRLKILNPDIETEIIPGVSSINAVSALSGMPLGLADEGIAIIPANYENIERLKKTVEMFDTVVLLKVHRVFREVLSIIDDLGLIDNAIYVSRAGMEGERIIRNLREVGDDDLDYFSMIIIKRNMK